MEKCNKCGEPSEIGAHGIRDGAVYSEYWCERCYRSKGSKGGKVDLTGIDTEKILTCSVRPDIASEGTLWIGENEWYSFNKGEWQCVFCSSKKAHLSVLREDIQESV